MVRRDDIFNLMRMKMMCKSKKNKNKNLILCHILFNVVHEIFRNKYNIYMKQKWN